MKIKNRSQRYGMNRPTIRNKVFKTNSSFPMK